MGVDRWQLGESTGEKVELERKQPKPAPERAAWKSLLAGAAGGLAGGWVMSQFSRWWNRTLPPLRTNTIRSSCLYSPQEWDSISRSAERLAAPFVNRKLSAHETRIGSAIVHYAVGGAAGALYGTAAHWNPSVAKFRGVGFGIAMWLVAGKLIMPALGLTGKPSTYSRLAQANALGEHLVYAFTVNLVYRGLTGRGENRP